MQGHNNPRHTALGKMICRVLLDMIASRNVDPYSAQDGKLTYRQKFPASPTTTAEEQNLLGTRLLAFPTH